MVKWQGEKNRQKRLLSVGNQGQIVSMGANKIWLIDADRVENPHSVFILKNDNYFLVLDKWHIIIENTVILKEQYCR